jgi:hypothetical protein
MLFAEAKLIEPQTLRLRPAAYGIAVDLERQGPRIKVAR